MPADPPAPSGASASAGGDVNCLLNAMYSIDVSDDGGTSSDDRTETDSDQELPEADADAELPSAPPTAAEMERAAERLEKRLLTAAASRRGGAAADTSAFAALDESDVSDFGALLPAPALDFGFELDDFQKRAVLCVERGENVFVAVPTSAGKTLVAEYAVEISRRGGGKAFYTAPIKTLSNQKFRDFSQKFDSVGIVTGDVSIAPESQCVVMTTEILRSMLYRNDDTLWTVQWVIFDEVQFVNDKDRGVVWETCIIMLPPHVRIVMLSATVPNALEFAAWVGKIREAPVSVVSLDERPVPLRHSLLHVDSSAPSSRTTLSQTVLLEQGGKFQSQNWASATKTPRADVSPRRDAGPRRPAGASPANPSISPSPSPVTRGRGGGGVGSDGGSGRGGGGRGGSAASMRGRPIGGRGSAGAGASAARGRGRGAVNGRKGGGNAARLVSSRGGGSVRQNELGGRSGDVSLGASRGSSSRGGGGRASDFNGSVTSRGGGGGGGRGMGGRGRGRGGVDYGGNSPESSRDWRAGASGVEGNGFAGRGRGGSGAGGRGSGERGRSGRGGGGRGGGGRGGGMRGPTAGHASSTWDPLVRFVEEQSLSPTIVFCFSKKRCGSAVKSLASMDLLPAASDKSRVHRMFQGAIHKLQECDRNLPQLASTLESLKKGIGCHHAGLLPLVKEVTEILFSEGLVKVLFATETFSIGVNFPAKSVVFVGIIKPDARGKRMIKSGEYIQMAGRAGRRGLDTVGEVFLFFSPSDGPLPEESHVRLVLTGPLEPLKSAFRLTYNMILNLLRVDELRVEDMMRQSFSEAAEELKMSSMTEVVDDSDRDFLLLEKWGAGTEEDQDVLRSYTAVLVRLEELSIDLLMKSVLPADDAAFHKGRIVVVKQAHHVLNFAMIVGAPEGPQANSRPGSRFRLNSSHKVPVLSLVASPSSGPFRSRSVLVGRRKDRDGGLLKNRTKHQFLHDGFLFELSLVAVSDLVWFSSKLLRKSKPAIVFPRNLPALPNELASLQASALPFLLEFVKSNILSLPESAASFDEQSDAASPNSIPTSAGLAPYEVANRAKATDEIGNMASRWNERNLVMSEFMKKSPESEGAATTLWSLSGGWLERKNVLNCIMRRERIRLKIEAVRASTKIQRAPELLEEYKKRVSVLMRMQYVGSDGLSVLSKGRMGACEVATVDSVLLTEMVLENVLDGLRASEIASLLSCLVCRQKNQGTGFDPNSNPKIFSPAYMSSKVAMLKIVSDFGLVQNEAGVDIDFEIGDCADYCDALCRFSLCEAVLRWAEGSTFADIMKLTDLEEGDVTNSVKRLSELLKDAANVADAVGNEELHANITEAIEIIKRDIIFNGSLYLE